MDITKQLLLIFTFLGALIAIVCAQQSTQPPAVIFCPLYLALQNRCPTPSTTIPPSTTTSSSSSTASSGNGTTSDEADVVDQNCGLPTINFCPELQLFLSGGRNCSEGQTITLSWTTLRELLADPSRQNAVEAVGTSNADALGSAFSSVAKTIQATPSQGTIGVTFIPVGQIIGG